MTFVVVIILQVIVFIFFAVFLKKMLSQNVTSATAHLDQMGQEYTKKEEEIKKMLEEAKHECNKQMAQAQEDAQKARADTIARANEEKDKIIENARKEADELIRQGETARQNLIVDIQEQIQKKAIEAASNLVGDILNDAMRSRIHSVLVSDFIDAGDAAVAGLGVIAPDAKVTLLAAYSLPDEEIAAITQILSGKLDRDLSLEQKIDSTLIAGIVITVESYVIDASFRWKIKERAKELIKEI